MNAACRDRGVLESMRRRNQRLLCVLTLAVWALPLSAQNGQYTPRFGMGHKPDVTVVPGSNVETNPIVDDDKCFPWKLSAAPAATVSAARLKIPLPAKREYEKACDASSKNDFGEAEQHARAAIGKFQGYSAAWVMLGMSLEGQQKEQEARDACAHAGTLDASYLPAYLCAAEISARNQDWTGVLINADQAVGLKTEGSPYPNLYRAKAYLHLNNLVEAREARCRPWKWMQTTRSLLSILFWPKFISARATTRVPSPSYKNC